MSLRAIASFVRSTLKYSIESSIRRALRTPAVSISTYFSRTPSVSTSNGTSMASRVVPGIGLTITRLDPVRALINEDLPTLGRPTIANRTGPYLRGRRLPVTSSIGGSNRSTTGSSPSASGRVTSPGSGGGR